MSEHYYGISFAILASILWSITVTLIKPITNNISPFLINPIKNSIGLLLFATLFIIMNIPFWYNHLYNYNFCIDTSDYIQPSGAINLSRFKKVELEIIVMEPEIDPSYISFTLCDGDGGVIGITKDENKYKFHYEMHFFEERYNILRFISGNAGLLFAR